MELLNAINNNNLFPHSKFENGMVVELDTGQKRMFWEGRFIDEYGFIPLTYYNRDLKNIDNIDGEENIDKIFTTKDIVCFRSFFNERNLTEIWSRY